MEYGEEKIISEKKYFNYKFIATLTRQEEGVTTWSIDVHKNGRPFDGGSYEFVRDNGFENGFTPTQAFWDWYNTLEDLFCNAEKADAEEEEESAAQSVAERIIDAMNAHFGKDKSLEAIETALIATHNSDSDYEPLLKAKVYLKGLKTKAEAHEVEN